MLADRSPRLVEVARRFADAGLVEVPPLEPGAWLARDDILVYPVPTGVTAANADLMLWKPLTFGSGARFNLHALTRGFDETTATWNRAAITGTGVPARRSSTTDRMRSDATIANGSASVSVTR